MYSIGKGANFKWVKLRSKCFEKDLPLPIAKVSLKSSMGEWIDFFPLVDSGAITSFFNKSDCEVLGYELEKGKNCEIKSASGHGIPCYIHSVGMMIGEEKITAQVAFSLEDNMGRGVLGRVDVFDNFEFDLRGKTEDTYVARDL